ncbi:MAG: hypothetical protein LBS09_06265, partial [Bacteroidales bacterium]|nr:hypothetical protein [Bacteroidales bacterium]
MANSKPTLLRILFSLMDILGLFHFEVKMSIGICGGSANYVSFSFFENALNPTWQKLPRKCRGTEQFAWA